MTEQRKGEIALIILKDRLQHEGIRLKPDMKREISNTAKRLNIPEDEFMELFEEMVRDGINKMFPPKSRSVRNLDHDS